MSSLCHLSNYFTIIALQQTWSSFGHRCAVVYTYIEFMDNRWQQALDNRVSVE